MNDNDDKLKKTAAQDEYREGDARFDVSSLDDVKDENGNGIFHMTTRFKWILGLSMLLLIAVCALIYAAYKDMIVAETWQLAIWIMCWFLAFWTVAKRSVPTLILNYVLFLCVSMIPLWKTAYENLQAMMKILFD